MLDLALGLSPGVALNRASMRLLSMIIQGRNGKRYRSPPKHTIVIAAKYAISNRPLHWIPCGWSAEFTRRKKKMAIGK